MTLHPPQWTLAVRQDRYQRRQPSRSRASSPVRRTLFHAPSFSAGVVMGAVVVLGAAYLPELLGDPAAVREAPAVAVVDARPELTFEFDQLLRNSRVIADPEPYFSAPRASADIPAGTPTGTTTAAEPEVFLLQAASFRSQEDAERLRAALLLMDLPASSNSTSLANGVWYRVTVGPFDSRVQAERAMTRLREKNIAAIWTRR